MDFAVPEARLDISVRQEVREEIADSPLLHDLLALLDHIDSHGGVPITRVRGTIARNHVAPIIERFRVKPGPWPPERERTLTCPRWRD